MELRRKMVKNIFILFIYLFFYFFLFFYLFSFSVTTNNVFCLARITCCLVIKHVCSTNVWSVPIKYMATELHGIFMVQC